MATNSQHRTVAAGGSIRMDSRKRRRGSSTRRNRQRRKRTTGTTGTMAVAASLQVRSCVCLTPTSQLCACDGSCPCWIATVPGSLVWFALHVTGCMRRGTPLCRSDVCNLLFETHVWVQGTAAGAKRC